MDRSGEDERWMERAIELADAAAAAGDVPVGAVLLDGSAVYQTANERERRGDPTAHAEVLAIRAAAEARGSWRLTGSTLYVTKEPCVMCAGAIASARIDRIVFGASDPKGGAAGSVIDIFTSGAVNHHVTVVRGVLEARAAEQLRSFFASRRGERTMRE